MGSFSKENEFENHCFKKEVFTDLRHKNFSQIVFEQCDFTQSDLTKARFLECKFRHCNFSLTKIKTCRMQDVEFENCKFVGVLFIQCDPMFLSLKFKKCLIDTCNFSDLNLKNTFFQDCVIRDSDFTNTNLTDSHFEGSDLKGSLFHRTILNGANFQKALNYSIDPLTNKLVKAKFSKPEVLSLLDSLDILIED